MTRIFNFANNWNSANPSESNLIGISKGTIHFNVQNLVLNEIQNLLENLFLFWWVKLTTLSLISFLFVCDAGSRKYREVLDWRTSGRTHGLEHVIWERWEHEEQFSQTESTRVCKRLFVYPHKNLWSPLQSTDHTSQWPKRVIENPKNSSLGNVSRIDISSTSLLNLLFWILECSRS